ncbi:MAG: acyl-CoA dehydrogenase [Thermoleophilaceae bacterium]|nr:acyl-CoA dehydrogenase [Thermoleophilaceae bacterium]
MTVAELTDEQLEFEESVRGFVASTLPPDRIRAFEDAGDIPSEVWDAFARQGLLGVGAPEAMGGSGGGATELALVVRELASASISVAMRYLASAYSGVQTLIRHGDEEQQRQFLGPFFEGDVEFGLGFTEPSGGADIRGWRTTARADGDGWTLSGSKTFTSNADHATRLILIARTANGESAHEGLSLFLVDPQAPGVTLRRIETMGQRAEATFEVNLDAVHVGADALVGEEGRGFYAALGSLDMERILVAAAAVGNAASALQDALRYAGERVAFGRPIGALQAVQHQLADCACDLEIAWLMTLKAARCFDEKGSCPMEATMAKYVASERAFAIVHRCMRVLGGYSFTTDFTMERRFRDAQLFLTGPISSEMARNFIGERLGLPKSY